MLTVWIRIKMSYILTNVWTGECGMKIEWINVCGLENRMEKCCRLEIEWVNVGGLE